MLHLLLLPFVAFDRLSCSGIAGAVIGIPFLVGTGSHGGGGCYPAVNSGDGAGCAARPASWKD